MHSLLPAPPPHTRTMHLPACPLLPTHTLDRRLTPLRLPPPPGQHVQALMRQQLERIVKTEGLSENVYEIASKSLKD